MVFKRISNVLRFNVSVNLPNTADVWDILNLSVIFFFWNPSKGKKAASLGRYFFCMLSGSSSKVNLDLYISSNYSSSYDTDISLGWGVTLFLINSPLLVGLTILETSLLVYLADTYWLLTFVLELELELELESAELS